MRARHVIAAALGLFLLAPGLAAAWTSDPAVNTTVCSAGADLEDVAVAEDGAGGVFLAWVDERSGVFDIYVQHLDATGAAQWAANGIPVHVDPGGLYPSVIADGAGGAIVVWFASGQRLQAQSLDADGNPLWGAAPVVVTGPAALVNYTDWITTHRLISDGAGGAIVVWEDARKGASDLDVYAQRLDAAGNRLWGADDVAVVASDAYEAFPAIAGDGAGGVLVGWYHNLDDSLNIKVQRLNSAGAALWPAGGVALASGDSIVESFTTRIVGDGAGGALVSWVTLVPPASPLIAQHLDALGAPQWGAGGVEVVSSVDDRPFEVRVQNLISDGAGGAIVAWMDWHGPLPGDGPGGDQGVHVQRLAASDGATQWPAGGVWVGPGSSGGLLGLPLVGDGSGGVIVAAQVSDHDSLADGLYAHRVDAAGDHPWGTAGTVVSTRSAATEFPVIAGDGAGGAILAWPELRNDDGDKDLFAQNVAGGGGASGLETPANQSPADGATTDATPDLGASAFTDNAGLLSHAGSQWRVHDAATLTPEVPLAERNTDDDFVDELPLPFPFPFYGRTITALAAGTNGMVELLEDGERSTWVGGAGNHEQGRYLDSVDAIFACNDDLDTTDGYLRVYDGGTYAMVEWYATTKLDGSIIDHPLRFQVLLSPNGEIRWNFRQLDFLMYGYDLFSGVYPNGGSEVAVGSVIDVQSSYRFDPGTSSVSVVPYSWQDAGPVLYDSGETAIDLTTHTVAASAGLADTETYYWGVRYRADNGEWSGWSDATSFLVAVPDIVVTDPVAPVDDTDLPFGSVEVESTASHTVAVSNVGNGALQLGNIAEANPLAAPFSIITDTCSGAILANGISCEFTVSFAPIAAGDVNDTFDIPSDDPDTPSVTVTLSGTGAALPAPDISVTDTAVPFGSVTVGSVADHEVTIANNGNAPLLVGQIAAVNPLTAPFTVFDDPCSAATIPGGDTCTVTLRFSPVIAGVATETLDIPSDDPDTASITVSLNGTGTAALVPNIMVTDSDAPTGDLQIFFWEVELGASSAPQDVTIANTGTTTLNLGQITLGNPASPFEVLSNDCTVQLPQGGSCTMQVQFTPAALGGAADTLSIPSDDPDTALVTVSLSGTGITATVPDITVTDSVDPAGDLQVPFGDQEVGVPSNNQSVTIANNGSAALPLGQITLDDSASPFAVVSDNCSGETLPPAGDCTLALRFIPAALGAATDTLSIPSDDPDQSTVTLSLSGTGVVVSLPPQIVSVSPTNGIGQVAIQVGEVTATFDKAMDPDTINGMADAFTLTSPSGAVLGIAGTPIYDVVAKTARFVIAGDLEYDTTYTAVVTTVVKDLAGTALAQAHMWSFTTGQDLGGLDCSPEIGIEDGCETFDDFTFGTGVELDTCSVNCTGPTAEDAARKRVNQGLRSASEDYSDDDVDLVAITHLDAARFVLHVRSRDEAFDSPGGTGVDASGATKIEVEGMAPGTLLPMQLLISGSTSGRNSNYAIGMEAQVYDFEYRPLVTVRTNQGPSSAEFQNTFMNTFRVPDPYLFNPADPNTYHLDESTSVPGTIRLDFLYPVESNNGVYVYFTVYTFKGDQQSDVKGEFVAQLHADPAPGVNVRLASGLIFRGLPDADGDGVTDAEDLDPDDAQMATPAAATGTGAIGIDTSANSGTTLAECRAISDGPESVNQTGKPADQTFPDGLVSFTVEGVAPGGSAVVTLEFPSAFPAGATYYKVDGTGFLEILPPTAVINGNTVTLTLSDDGTNGDLVAGDGVIEDPGGVAVPPSPGSDSGGGGGGGGCFLQTIAGDRSPQ